MKAMHRAIEQAYEKVPFQKLHIDGTYFVPYQVNCTDVRLASFLRAVGIAKPTYQDNFLTFTSPIIRDCLLQEFYPVYDNINEIPAPYDPTLRQK
jgi:hypothetical protein